MRSGRLACVALVSGLWLALAACTRSVDLKQVLQITDASGGWYDAGVVQGKNKLVPGVTFRLRKTGNADVSRHAINALFRAADGAESQLDNDVFVQNVELEGDQTAPIHVRSENGYTAEPPQSRADMLKHSQFRDLRVQIFVKQGAAQWVDLGTIPVQRTLITQ
jgi:hypothetical protein